MTSIDPYFRGRINRKEFLIGDLSMSVAVIFIQIATSPFYKTNISHIDFAISTAIALPFYALITSIRARRLHDMETSGWISILGFVPFLSIALFLVLLFKPGTKGANKYGPQPAPNRQLLNTLLFPTN